MPPTDAESDEVAIALRLESHASAKTCQQTVGATWSLLSGDQPTRAQMENNAGRRSLMVGKLDEAQLSFCRATVLDPTNTASFRSLAELLLLLRDAKQARQWAERAVKQTPEDQHVQSLYGDTLARVGEVDAARTVWLNAVGVDPDDRATIRKLSLTYAATGRQYIKGADYPRGDRFFRRAALLDTSNATAAAGMGQALLMQKEVSAALAWSKRAVALEPRDTELRILLGDAYAKSEQLDAAYKEWLIAVALDPGNARAHARYNRIPPEKRPEQ